MIDNLIDIVNNTKKQNPLIHHITNYVTVNDCANVTLAVGASPAMACKTSQLKHQIVDDLLKLNFVRYRAFWGRDQVPDETARMWNPLLQPWLSFVESGKPGEGLVVFEAIQKLHPPLHAHSAFLLQA